MTSAGSISPVQDVAVTAGPFTLGTVQMGQMYGIADAQLDHEDTLSALDLAARSGITWLDTGRAYGVAEDCIGEWLATRGTTLRIITKIRPLINVYDQDLMVATRASLDESLRKLGVSCVDVCLTHRAADLLKPSVVDELRSAQFDGRIKCFGSSIYTLDELEGVLNVDGVAAVQLPLSVVSQEFCASGLIRDLRNRGIIVFVRSVFLQGALLMAPERLPSQLVDLKPTVIRLRSLAESAGLSLQTLLIAAVKSVDGVWSPVLGIESLVQLEDLLAAAQNERVPAEIIEAAFEAGRGLPRYVVDPRMWSKSNRT